MKEDLYSSVPRAERIPVAEAEQEERGRLTREALAEVDSGLVIDQRRVRAWAASLSSGVPLPLPR